MVNYGSKLFTIGRSGDNILSRPSKCENSSVKKLVNSFISERVLKYWNKLPNGVKHSASVLDFKINLESFKKDRMLNDTGNYWEISEELLCKIEGGNYLENKRKQVDYLKGNPGVAKRKGINLF